MGLLHLPPETLLRVSSSLTTPELGCLRRTCKHVEAALFDSFAREFFTKRQFMLEQVSLQVLIDIAKHPTLSRRLTDLIISLHTFHDDPNHMTRLARKRYQAGHVSHRVLLETGQARDMLVEAMSLLPNLRTVGLRDYNARGRYRDGDDASWRSYGWSYAIDEDLEENTPRSLWSHARGLPLTAPTSSFPLILYAVGLANVKIESVEVFLRRHQKLTPASFNVVDGIMGPKVIPVLSGLKKLMLTIGFDGVSAVGHQDDSAEHSASLKRLLQHTPNLETLRLNFEEEQFSAYHSLAWLGPSMSAGSASAAAPTINTPLASTITLSNLTRLDLGMLNTLGSTLLDVVTKFNLVSLSLWKVSIHNEPLVHTYDEHGPWGLFLKQVADSLPVSTRLNSVLIGWPSQCELDHYGLKSTQVYFTSTETGSDAPGRHRLDKVTYRAAYGANVRDWFRSLATRTAQDSQESADEISTDDESEDGEDEEDEDDEEHDEDDEDEGA